MPHPEDDGVKQPTPAEEAEWVASALRGDPQAFDRMVQAYSRRIYTHLYRLLGNREDAEDLAQETFVRAYRYLDRYDTERSLRSWLYTIASRVGLNALRTRRRRLPSVAAAKAGTLVDRPDPKADSHAQAVRDEMAAHLSETMKRLPPRTALLLHLHYREGLTIAEAARMTDMTEGAAKVALHRARQSLREWLVEDEHHEL